MLLNKEKTMQQAMYTTVNDTRGGGTHTRWNYDDDYTQEELKITTKAYKKAYKKAYNNAYKDAFNNVNKNVVVKSPNKNIFY